jgi:uncharacterized repeat protein (TIGR03806 family)
LNSRYGGIVVRQIEFRSDSFLQRHPAFPVGLALLGLVLIAVAPFARQESTAADTSSVAKAKAFDLTKRIPWTESHVQGSPDPLPPYTTQVAFPKLKFDEPLNLATAPGSDRFFIAERQGKVFSFVNHPNTDQKELLLDVGKTTYGLALHPKFQENGYLYVVCVTDALPVSEGTQVVRYQVPREASIADPASAKVILTWPTGGHNGGCLRFGPDGMLYISTGDGSGIADELKTGQDLSDLLASMLRIDVDHPDTGKNYGIPKDNPFDGKADCRPEIYAYGIRQMWKFGFDRAGTLWAGEVGQDLWEMIHIVVPGGNYGWSVQEGSHPFRPERKLGPSPIIPPIVEHHHVDFRSITGGFVYEGSRLPELRGTYIYGDYDTGKIWGFKYDKAAKKVTEHRELADGVLRIVEWGQDASGEMYFLDHIGGQIHQLVKAPEKVATAPFPQKLSETGLFASTKDLTPAPGLIPYSVNSQLWSDGAVKERYLAIPGTGKIDFDAITYPQPSPGAPAGYRFPNGTVAVKTFFMDMEQGNPASRKRLETRLLVFEQVPGTQEMGDQVWQGYTYIWNDDQTDAVLAGKNGKDVVLRIKDASASGGVREQTWHFPSRAQCSMCHTTPAKYVLGLNTLQLNKDYDYGNGHVMNQIAAWEKLGMFEKPLPKPVKDLPKLVDYHDAHASVTDRARSYLHSNCAHCHVKWGGGNAEFQLLATLDLKDTGTIGVPPAHGAFGIAQPAILSPGHPEKSLVLHRMKLTGLGRMPHIGSSVVDKEGVDVVEAWLKTK